MFKYIYNTLWLLWPKRSPAVLRTYIIIIIIYYILLLQWPRKVFNRRGCATQIFSSSENGKLVRPRSTHRHNNNIILRTLMCDIAHPCTQKRAVSNHRILRTRNGSRIFVGIVLRDYYIVRTVFFSFFSYTVLSASSDRHFFPPLPPPPPTFRRFHIYKYIFTISNIRNAIRRAEPFSRSRGRDFRTIEEMHPNYVIVGRW